MRTVRPLTTEELNSKVEMRKRQIFDDIIKAKYGDSISPPPKSFQPMDENEHFIEYEDDYENYRKIPDFEDDVYDVGAINACYKFIYAHLRLPHEYTMAQAIVKRRKLDADGNTVGTYNDNPILNTAVYEMEFDDGLTKKCATNIIADNIYQQVDRERRMFTTMEGIIDHRNDDSAVNMNDKYVITKRGWQRLQTTTKGWQLLVLWKTSDEQWILLKDIKKSHSVDVAEYAIAKGIDREPAFCW